MFLENIERIKTKIEKKEGKVANFFDVSDYIARSYIINKYDNEDEYINCYRHLQLTLELAPFLINKLSCNHSNEDLKQAHSLLQKVEKVVTKEKERIFNLWKEQKLEEETEWLENWETKTEALKETQLNLLKEIKNLFGNYDETEEKEVKRYLNL